MEITRKKEPRKQEDNGRCGGRIAFHISVGACLIESKSLNSVLRLALRPLACAVRQVDEIPLSRPKRSIARDFADGGEFAQALHNSLGHP